MGPDMTQKGRERKMAIRLHMLAVLLAMATSAAHGQDGPGNLSTKSFVYKKPKQADLEIVVHFPPGWKETDKRPAIVFFFGGGWTHGKITQFEPQATHLASHGG